MKEERLQKGTIEEGSQDVCLLEGPYTMAYLVTSKLNILCVHFSS